MALKLMSMLWKVVVLLLLPKAEGGNENGLDEMHLLIVKWNECKIQRRARLNECF